MYIYIYIDYRRDATLVALGGEYGKLYKLIELEEHDVVIGQPEEFYLSLISPNDGKGFTIAKSIYDFIEDSGFEESLVIAGADSTATLTGA